MENIQDHSNSELDGEERRDVGSTSTSCSSVYRLFGRQKPMHQIMGGGQGKFFLTYLTKFIIRILFIEVMV